MQEDGSFAFGPLPIGEVMLMLCVTTFASDGSSFSAPRPVHAVVIQDGVVLAAEIDLRDTFPGRLREHVVIDELAASGGGISWTLGGGGPSGAGGRSVDLDGNVVLGSLVPGAYRITYASKDKTWGWLVPQPITIEPGQERAHELRLHTTARDLSCGDIAGGAALANVEIEWRTGLGGKELESKARTDVNGVLPMRMPEQNVELRCAGDSGAFTTIAWVAGSGPLTVALRRAP